MYDSASHPHGVATSPVGFEIPIDRSHLTSDSTVTVIDKIQKKNDGGLPEYKHKLRYDWTNMPIQSREAKFFQDHQGNCDLPITDYSFRNRFGLGSDLHVWTQAVCNAAELKVRVKSILPWIWWDESSCLTAAGEQATPIQCYFPKAELSCKGDVEKVAETTMKKRQSYRCDGIMQNYNVSEFRAGGIEYLFSSVSPVLINDAERQLNIIFPNGVPPDLITVQVRWGDKLVEMTTFISIEEYIGGVYEILKARNDPPNRANIFLATEDPRAVKAFREKAPPGWTLHVDQYHEELKGHRNKVSKGFEHTKGSNYNENPRISEATKGKAGLIALGSLLVAMEANDFVLTTASNWSRLMNELRKNVVEPRCGRKTHVVDLMQGEW